MVESSLTFSSLLNSTTMSLRSTGPALRLVRGFASSSLRHASRKQKVVVNPNAMPLREAAHVLKVGPLPPLPISTNPILRHSASLPPSQHTRSRSLPNSTNPPRPCVAACPFRATRGKRKRRCSCLQRAMLQSTQKQPVRPLLVVKS